MFAGVTSSSRATCPNTEMKQHMEVSIIAHLIPVLLHSFLDLLSFLILLDDFHGNS